MKKDNNYLTIIVLKTEEERSRYGQGYKYLIKRNGHQSYTAYNTDEGIREFLKRNQMTMKKHPHFNNSYILNKNIEEKSFWKLSDIENIGDCISYYNLSNGSLVTCYSQVLDDKIINYRPNPNAKNVYKPFPLKAHLEYQRIYG